MIDDKDIPKQRDLEFPSGNEMTEKIKQQIKNTQIKEIDMGLPNNFGVDNFVKLIVFAGNTHSKVYEALADDGKVSIMEGIGMAVSLGPQAFGLISAVPQIPKEIVFDQITEEEFQQIADGVQESFEYMKGDTKQAAKDLVKWLINGRDWALNYIVKPDPKPTP